MVKHVTLIRKQERKIVDNEYTYLESIQPDVCLSSPVDRVSERERTPSVIALIGQVGSGKSEVARHLIINHSYKRLEWSHHWRAILTNCLSVGHKMVCDDDRFDEISLHIFSKTEIWRILRKGLSSPDKLNFTSFNRTIKNYGSIGELKTAVDGILLSSGE